MNPSTVDRCPRCGATRISYGGGHMACCGGCGLIADEEVFKVSTEEIVTEEMVADFADTAGGRISTHRAHPLAELAFPPAYARPFSYDSIARVLLLQAGHELAAAKSAGASSPGQAG